MRRQPTSVALFTVLTIAPPWTVGGERIQQPPALAEEESREPRRQDPLDTSQDATDVRLHPFALGDFIDVLGGRRVILPVARVIAVINPRAFLIESAGPLPPVGRPDRLLVLVDATALRVDATALVGSNVRVLGIARTLLGIQVTGEVPWPTELTRQMVERLDIRAAVLARSVQTTDGVELTDRKLLTPDTVR